MFSLLHYEKNLLDQGLKHIAGIDEAGRGPLAGPLVASAVVLDLNRVFSLLSQGSSVLEDSPHKDKFYTQINDSKKLSYKKRLYLNRYIIIESISYSVVKILHKKIDRVGLTQATQEAFYKAIKKLKVIPDYILTDMYEVKKITKQHQINIPGGDFKSMTIASASIVAKVHRDKYMEKMHKKYPNYGFDKHKGYGTKAHKEAIFKHGPCEIHRKSFEPVKSLIKDNY